MVAAAIVAVTMASYLVVAMVVPPEFAILGSQLAIAAIPVGAAFVVPGVRPLRALGLRGAHPQFFLAAILIGASAWYINMRLVAWLPLPEREARVLEHLVERPTLAAALLSFAVLPAVCEELVFRGVLARALGRHLPLAGAAAISAVVFSAYHMSIVQALPTLTLGMVLGAIAIRADSIVPTILAHAINNAIALSISRGELPGVTGWLERSPVVTLIVCITATAGGLAIALRGTA